MTDKDKLMELVDAYAEARHIQGHSTYNIKTAAARQAVIEALSAVQALSAAPAGFVPVSAFDRLHAHAESLAARLLAAEQATPKAAPGDVFDEALRERDDAEDFIDALLDEVLGHERPEWSSSYGRADALNDVQERMTALHKPAVDKAWGRFQSAMAAPQQEAQADSQPVPVVDKCTKQQMTTEVLRRMQQQEDGHNKNPFRSLLDRLMRNEGGYSTIEIGQLKYALDGFYGAARAPADSVTAPQQEAQEPALFVSAKQLADFVDPSHATGGSYLPARKTRAGLFTQPLYTAPQPAPAPLSFDACDMATAAAQGFRSGQAAAKQEE